MLKNENDNVVLDSVPAKKASHCVSPLMLDFFKRNSFDPLDPNEILCLFMFLIENCDGGIPQVCSLLLLQIIVANLIVLKGLSVI